MSGVSFSRRVSKLNSMDVKVLVLAYLSINTTTQWKRIQSKIRY
jgi:hypothetical protein